MFCNKRRIKNLVMMIIYFIAFYLVITLIVTAFATGKRISFANAFTYSFFMTPFVGLLAVLKSEKKVKITHYVTRYSCPRCNAKFTSETEYCPSCLEEGVKVKPQQMEIRMAG